LFYGYRRNGDYHSYLYDARANLLGTYDGEPDAASGVVFFRKYTGRAADTNQRGHFVGPAINYMWRKDGKQIPDTAAYFIGKTLPAGQIPLARYGPKPLKWGLMDSTGHLVEPLSYAAFFPYGTGYIRIKDSQNTLFASRPGGPVYPWPFRSVDTLAEDLGYGFFMLRDSRYKKKTLFRWDGKIIVERPSADEISPIWMGRDYYVVTTYVDGKEVAGLIDRNGRQILDFKYQFFGMQAGNYVLVNTTSQSSGEYHGIFDLRTRKFIVNPAEGFSRGIMTDSVTALMRSKDSLLIVHLPTKNRLVLQQTGLNLKVTTRGTYAYYGATSELVDLQHVNFRKKTLKLGAVVLNTTVFIDSNQQGVFDFDTWQVVLPSQFDTVILRYPQGIKAVKNDSFFLFTNQGRPLLSSRSDFNIVGSWKGYYLIDLGNQIFVLDSTGAKIATMPVGGSYAFTETGYALSAYPTYSIVVRLAQGTQKKLPGKLKITTNAHDNPNIPYLESSLDGKTALFDKSQFDQATPFLSMRHYYYHIPGLFLVEEEYERNRWRKRGYIDSRGKQYWQD